MPFKSEQQRRYLWKNEPQVAKEWSQKEKQKAYAKEMRKASATNQGGGSIGNSMG